MKAEKRLGIWMDHSTAHLMEFTVDPVETKTLELTDGEKSQNHGKSENLLHNKEQHQQAAFYKRLADIIKNYDEVILFGPTDAKVELFNTLRLDHRFLNIKIEIQQSDNMTENQQHAFVKEHFSKRYYAH